MSKQNLLLLAENIYFMFPVSILHFLYLSNIDMACSL